MLRALQLAIWLVVLAKAVLQAVDTDLTPLQLALLGEKALASGVTGGLRLPVDGSYTDDGSSLTVTDLQSNIAALQLAVYGDGEQGTIAH